MTAQTSRNRCRDYMNPVPREPGLKCSVFKYGQRVGLMASKNGRWNSRIKNAIICGYILGRKFHKASFQLVFIVCERQKATSSIQKYIANYSGHVLIQIFLIL